MSAKTAQVDGGLMPVAACLCLVISAVFIHVQKPIYQSQHGSRVVEIEQRTHSSICLSNTTTHTTKETSSRGARAHGDSSGLNLGGSEQQNSTLR